MVPGPVMVPPLSAVRRITFFKSGTGRSLCQSTAWCNWPSGQTRASSPYTVWCSMKRCTLPFTRPPRGRVSHSICPGGKACSTSSSACTVGYRVRCSSVVCVGNIKVISPRAARCRASAGWHHSGSNCSASSVTGVWPSGMRATRKGTSKRMGISSAAVQRASGHSASAARVSPSRAHCGKSGWVRSICATSASVAQRPSAWRASSTPISSRLSRMAAWA
ncbi:hypothetical protein D3C72_1471290 [compost metagenome]